MSKTASKTTKTVVPSKTTTFEVPEAIKEAMPKAQNAALAAYLAANPNAYVGPVVGVVAEGCLPAYLRNPNGKRADIVRMMVKGMSVALFLKEAKRLGGGHTDLIAGVLGGYSRSSPTWGKAAFTITAAA
jgi:hypothetical protein|tara:strand:- start:81 stop:470 length:390 start_codon:yes stop_codon:yes gene_type:complete